MIADLMVEWEETSSVNYTVMMLHFLHLFPQKTSDNLGASLRMGRATRVAEMANATATTNLSCVTLVVS
jgi:hypothetical protein